MLMMLGFAGVWCGIVAADAHDAVRVRVHAGVRCGSRRAHVVVWCGSCRS